MQPIEVGLFVVIVALALALIGTIVRPQLGGRRKRVRRVAPQTAASARPEAGGVASAGLVCPACLREYPDGLRFCPQDARELVPAGDSLLRGLPSLSEPTAGAACPACRRSYDALKRFCPFDGEELAPLPLAAGAGIAPPRELVAATLGKICPHCSRRYEGEATFCGRDGSELVTVN